MEKESHSTREQIYRIYRRIRFLIRHSSKKRTPLTITEQVVPKKELTLRYRIYRVYRILRFLWRTGALTTVPVKNISGSFRFTDYPKRTYLAIGINSLAVFLITYLLVYFLSHLITALSASAFGIRTILYYYDVEYLIRGYDWTDDAVKAVFSSAPLFSLLFALLLLILYLYVAAETGLLRLFVLWAFCHFILRFFGDMFVGVILDEGFGYVIMYLFVMDTGKMILCLFAFICLFTLGYMMTRYFLYSGNSYFNAIRRNNRIRFDLAQFILPMILGNILIILVKIPQITLFEIFLNASMLFLLLPVLLRSINLQDLFFDEDPRKVKIVVRYIILAILLGIVFRVVLSIGIKF